MILKQTKNYILNRLQAEQSFVDEFVSNKDPKQYFDIFTVRKKNGQTRTIYRLKDTPLRDIYKKIYEELIQYRKFIHPAAHGFIKGRSIATNAELHLCKKYLLHLDIEDFFSSISYEKVKENFERLGSDKYVAEMMAGLCTVEGKLPQGPQTSPDISNHCFYEIDAELSSFAKSENLVYTRYADDITLSSNKEIPKDDIKEIITKHGFKLENNKTKIQKRGSNQYVTGLTVFDNQRPRVSKRYKRNLRLEIHLLKKIGLESYVIEEYKLGPPPRHDEDQLAIWEAELQFHCVEVYLRINGQICFINGVEPQRAKLFWNEFKDVDNGIIPDHYLSKNDRKRRDQLHNSRN